MINCFEYDVEVPAEDIRNTAPEGFTHLMALSREAFDLFSAGSYINWMFV